MGYGCRLLAHAQREIRKLPDRALQRSVLKTCTADLEANPRPEGYERVQGYQDVFRVYSEDRNYRIIYSIQEQLQTVIVLSVRRRGEATYKNLPIKSLRGMIQDLENDQGVCR